MQRRSGDEFYVTSYICKTTSWEMDKVSFFCCTLHFSAFCLHSLHRAPHTGGNSWWSLLQSRVSYRDNSPGQIGKPPCLVSYPLTSRPAGNTPRELIGRFLKGYPWSWSWSVFRTVHHGKYSNLVSCWVIASPTEQRRSNSSGGSK